MEIKYHKNFLKDLKKISSKILLEKIKLKILEFKNSDDLLELLDIKKLKGFSNFYRVRIGNYRLGFRFEENIIIFDRILHRKDIYKKYP